MPAASSFADAVRRRVESQMIDAPATAPASALTITMATVSIGEVDAGVLGADAAADPAAVPVVVPVVVPPALVEATSPTTITPDIPEWSAQAYA